MAWEHPGTETHVSARVAANNEQAKQAFLSGVSVGFLAGLGFLPLLLWMFPR